MQVVNYQKELEKILAGIEKKQESGEEVPTLFLHSCCAPCSSYVLKYLRSYFEVTVFYYNPNYADCPEGGERCFLCYEMRLRKTAEEALARGFSYFGTTLTISPLKNAAKLNEIGQRIEKELGILWLPSDFKKKEGYKQSIELSGEYGLYRQDFCGCAYSKAERERQRREKNELL